MSSPQRLPYQGKERKLLLAFDVGTTYSGISYSLLEPGEKPQTKGVTRFPGQTSVGGDSKIPSVIFYDQRGKAAAIGAEALLATNLESAEDEGWVKVEWFKLHLRPKALMSTHIKDEDVPDLPPNKTAVDVLSDFLVYLYNCAKVFIQETHANGVELWHSVAQTIQFVLSHPNGWAGVQQNQMRNAAILGGIIPNTEDGRSRIEFVTEGEASLHFCIANGLASEAMKSGRGVMIVDAGGGTVDLSAYALKKSPFSVEEIAPPECRLQGSVFISRRARFFLEGYLRGSRYGSPEDVKHIADCFDKTTKLVFKNESEPAYIKFGAARDKDPNFNIRMGQMKLKGTEVAALFEPSLHSIIHAIEQQLSRACVDVTTIFLVGGFAASDWLFTKIQAYLRHRQINFCRPDSHLNKAVADGAISYYVDHFVSIRSASSTYGIEVVVDFDGNDPAHRQRSGTTRILASGTTVVPGYFSTILPQGAQVSETKEFKEAYVYEGANRSQLGEVSIDITSCIGDPQKFEWITDFPDMFPTLCTVKGNTTRLAASLKPEIGLQGQQYYRMPFEVVLLFGRTELAAQISWLENNVEKRGPAKIVYNEDI